MTDSRTGDILLHVPRRDEASYVAEVLPYNLPWCEEQGFTLCLGRYAGLEDKGSGDLEFWNVKSPLEQFEDVAKLGNQKSGDCVSWNGLLDSGIVRRVDAISNAHSGEVVRSICRVSCFEKGQGILGTAGEDGCVALWRIKAMNV